MDDTGCEEQVAAVALSGKGEETLALLPGVETVMPFEDVPLTLLLTETETSATQEAPALPQALTWSV